MLQQKMRIIKIIKIVTILFIGIIGFIGCSKEFDFGKTTNAIKTIESTNLTQTSANVSGAVITDNGSSLSEKGICYSSTNRTPTTSDSKKTFSSATLGDYMCVLNNLTPNTTYYARAYASNSYGTAYGSTITFKTLEATVPIISETTVANSITGTTAKSGGVITHSGSSTIISRGVCYSSTINNPTISNAKTNDGTGIGTFTSTLSGLTPNTTYYIRAYATNSAGTAYGDIKSLKTANVTVPNGITTLNASSITQTTAFSGGNIIADGGSTITARGVCWSSTTSNPTISDFTTNNGSGTGSFSSSINGLAANTTYYVRTYATNIMGTSYGNTITFKTTPSLTIGQSHQGGIIAYIFQPGDNGYVSGEIHGLITTTSNQSFGIEWGCYGSTISGTSTNLGTGVANTNTITSRCIGSTIAASICNNLSTGGYTDWYLPSYIELGKLYSNKNTIGGFNNSSYWSSSQFSSTDAYSINFNTGTGSSTPKYTLLNVRAIRKF